MDRDLRNRLVPGATLLDDHNTWSPVVPADLHAPAPAITAGRAPCSQCETSFPLDELDITAAGYLCASCRRAPIAAPLPDDVKVGRGRWWILPIVIAAGAAITIIAPMAVFAVVLVVGALCLRLFMRRGL